MLQNATSDRAALVITNDCYGIIKNLTIKNHNTQFGPTLIFIGLSKMLIVENLYIFSNNFETWYIGKIGFLSSSLVNFSNFKISNFKSLGFFDVQYFSFVLFNNVIMDKICIKNENAKGGFIFIDSYANVTVKNLWMNEIILNNSLIYIVNSAIVLMDVSLVNMSLSYSEKDIYYITIDSSYVSMNNLKLISFNNDFIYQDSGTLYIKNSIIFSDIDNSIYWSMYYNYYPYSVVLQNNSFINLSYTRSVNF